MQSLPNSHTLARPIGRAMIDGPAQFVPLAAARARLGFPSPADDFMDDAIDLHRLLVRNPAATFLYRADGWSMSGAGVSDGDILVVDRSVTPRRGTWSSPSGTGTSPPARCCSSLKATWSCTRPIRTSPIVLEQSTEVEVFAVVGVVRQIKRRSGRVRAR